MKSKLLFIALAICIAISACKKDEVVPDKSQETAVQENQSTFEVADLISLIEKYEALVPGWIESGAIKQEKGEEILLQFESYRTDFESIVPETNERSFIGDIVNFLIGIFQFFNDLGLLSDADFAQIVADLNSFRCQFEVFDYDGDGVNCRNDCDDNNNAVYPGAPCDDGNALTENDMYNADCVCEGDDPATGVLLEGTISLPPGANVDLSGYEIISMVDESPAGEEYAVLISEALYYNPLIVADENDNILMLGYPRSDESGFEISAASTVIAVFMLHPTNFELSNQERDQLVSDITNNPSFPSVVADFESQIALGVDIMNPNNTVIANAISSFGQSIYGRYASSLRGSQNRIIVDECAYLPALSAVDEETTSDGSSPTIAFSSKNLSYYGVSVSGLGYGISPYDLPLLIPPVVLHESVGLQDYFSLEPSASSNPQNYIKITGPDPDTPEGLVATKANLKHGIFLVLKTVTPLGSGCLEQVADQIALNIDVNEIDGLSEFEIFKYTVDATIDGIDALNEVSVPACATELFTELLIKLKLIAGVWGKLLDFGPNIFSGSLFIADWYDARDDIFEIKRNLTAPWIFTDVIDPSGEPIITNPTSPTGGITTTDYQIRPCSCGEPIVGLYAPLEPYFNTDPQNRKFYVLAAASWGLAPYTFSWSWNLDDGSSGSCENQREDPMDYQLVGKPGTYYLTVTDANECTHTATGLYVPYTCTNGDPCKDCSETEGLTFDENCECSTSCVEQFTDPRDGRIYCTVDIGTQTWFAENLNYTTGNSSDNSWCHDNNSANCSTYGRLYDWQTALTGCPVGWHLPSDAEWTQLTDYLGGEDIAGGYMKEAGLAHWNGPNAGATNESGFSGLPGGNRNLLGLFSPLGSTGGWWSDTEVAIDADVWKRSMYYTTATVGRNLSDTGSGLSVRCVKD